MFCAAAFDALTAQKQEFLQHHPDALYPCDSTVFSAITFELGGPHCRGFGGSADRHQAETWSVLHALGDYSSLHGGHIILWDLGLVVCFPPGSSILIPTGIIRYSFVRVRPGETRYSVIQHTGGGIARWFSNGKRTDVDFARKADSEQHATREANRRAAHDEAADIFLLEEELPSATAQFPFTGTWDPAAEVAFS
ncbi:hypothetical protein B0H16DRAFT_1348124 [Mycena metata]|uniref:Uncharacterized protein n=1 Tax=Mycena metata TaxID=1033252 RepID=A0AAD7GQL3_9AGAR|nr:hypothetical protein B0H16DRAFT_1348124 [Mycena metata]